MYENISYYTIVVLIWCYGIVAYSNAQNLVNPMKMNENNQKNSMKLPKRLFLHAHYYNSNKPSLRDEKRSENMSMLFVLRIENYNGKYLVSSLIKGYGRDLIIRFYHPIFKEYVKISDENDANEFLSSLLLEKKFVNELSPFKVGSTMDHRITKTKQNVKYVGDIHGHVYVSSSGNGLARLAASNIGLWNISQRQTPINNNNDKEEKIVLLGQVDIGVDNVLGKLDRNALAYEFPRHKPPIFLNSSINKQIFDDMMMMEKEINLYKSLNVKEQIIYCESPNAFGIPPKVFKRGSNYLFSGNGMFYITKQPLKNENNKKKSMKVHGIGKFHQVYSSIIDILNMKDKNVLDLGAGLGFISFYILFETNNIVKSVTAVDFDYNYIDTLNKVVKKKKDFKTIRNKFNTIVKRIEFNEKNDMLNIPVADIVFAPASLLEVFTTCNKHNIRLDNEHGDNNVPHMLERYISTLSLRTIETLIIEFVDLKDPTLSWALNLDNDGNDVENEKKNRFISDKVYNRVIFEELLDKYFSEIILINHPTPTRSIYLVTKQLDGNENLFVMKKELQRNVRKQKIFHILKDSSKLFLTNNNNNNNMQYNNNQNYNIKPILQNSNILIGIVVDNYDKYLQQAVTWLNSLRWNGGQTNICADVMVCVLPGVPKQFQKYMSSLGAIIRPIMPLSEHLPGITPHSNKLRFFQQPEILNGTYKTIVYMDTDILIFNDIVPYLSHGGRGGEEPIVAKFRAGRTVW